MTGLFSWIRRLLRPRPTVENGTVAFEKAMQTSGELIGRFEQASGAPDPIRAMFADMWLERHNVPYVTTLFEAHQEMLLPLRQRSGQTRQ